MTPKEALNYILKHPEDTCGEQYLIVYKAIDRLEELEKHYNKPVLLMSRSRGQMKKMIEELSHKPAVLVSNIVDVQKVECFEIIKRFNDYEIVNIQGQWYLMMGNNFMKCPKMPITEKEAMLLKEHLK